MKVLILLALCFLACVFADDANVACPGAVLPTCPSISDTEVENNDWTTATVTAGTTVCYNIELDDVPDGSDFTFVVAARPGSEAAGNTTFVQVYAFNNNTTPNMVCAQTQPGQEDDDMDYVCANGTLYSQKVTVALVYANATGSATLDFYAGFNDGTVGECTASYVSSSGSSVWLWVILGVAVVLVIVVILAAVGGFIYMKKKKSSYQLYEDA